MVPGPNKNIIAAVVLGSFLSRKQTAFLQLVISVLEHIAAHNLCDDFVRERSDFKAICSDCINIDFWAFSKIKYSKSDPVLCP
jgi:hypothetical protein